MGNGFSLLELLIAMALLGILSSISYPLYREYIIKKNHEQAEIVLLEMANRLEEEHVMSGSYGNVVVAKIVPPSAEKLPFHFVITNQTEQEYLLKAIPTSTQKSASLPCYTLTLSSHGDHCW